MGCRGSKKKRSTVQRSGVRSAVQSTVSDYAQSGVSSDVGSEAGSEVGSETGTSKVAATSGVGSQVAENEVLNVRIKISDTADEATSKVIGKPSSGLQQTILKTKSRLPAFPGQMASKLQYQSELNSKYSQFDSRFDGSSVLSQGGSSVLSSQIHSSAVSGMGTGSNVSSSNISSAMSSAGSSVLSRGSTGGSSVISQGGSSFGGSGIQSSAAPKGRSKARSSVPRRSSTPRTTAAGSKVTSKASKFLAEKTRVGTTPSQIFTKYLGDKKDKKAAGSKVR